MKNISTQFKFKSFLLLVAFSSLQVNAIEKTFEEKVQEYRNRQDTISPAEALKFLKNGNERFALGKSIHGGYLTDSTERRQISALSQRPVATVLSCIDSRTTPELVFDTSVGDLFTARVGANTLNKEILGSLEITVESGSKAIVVLGHTDCGGIKAACNNLELGHFTSIVEKIRPVISAVNIFLDQNQKLSTEIGERLTSNKKYIGYLGHANAENTVKQILEQSSIIDSKVKSGEIVLVPAVYNVDSGIVNFSGLTQ